MRGSEPGCCAASARPGAGNALVNGTGVSDCSGLGLPAAASPMLDSAGTASAWNVRRRVAGSSGGADADSRAAADSSAGSAGGGAIDPASGSCRARKSVEDGASPSGRGASNGGSCDADAFALARRFHPAVTPRAAPGDGAGGSRRRPTFGIAAESRTSGCPTVTNGKPPGTGPASKEERSAPAFSVPTPNPGDRERGSGGASGNGTGVETATHAVTASSDSFRSLEPPRGIGFATPQAGLSDAPTAAPAASSPASAFRTARKPPPPAEPAAAAGAVDAVGSAAVGGRMVTPERLQIGGQTGGALFSTDRNIRNASILPRTGGGAP